jgi:hypothetical protein
MEANVSKADVEIVANRLHIDVTEAEIERIMLLYPAWQEQDITGNWDLVVEDLIYHVTDAFIL